jgi:EAL domain-containing protein (putative c-di-GMP-specific phosphodiesterase class I)/F0F1-type ATP synthase membrane subunit c/vacuolar-type H+-ATPase subunit K
VFSCFAIACGVFVLVAKTQQAQAVVAAIFLLAIGQLCVIGLGWARGLTLQDAIRGIARERRAADEKYNKSFVTAKLFENEIADLKRRMGLSEKEIQEEMAAMRAQFNELAERYAADAANARLQQQQMQQQMQQQPNPAEFPVTLQGAAVREHFNFLLEPIIDLTTNRTAHYRVRFSITAANGIEIDYSKLTLNADRSELRPTLDVHVINQAIPLLRRLRAKHPAMRMFIPMGAATLMSGHTIAMVTQMLSEADNVAQGVVFELTHESLAGLNEAGISGLAAIARMGATLALTEASIAGLDLPALRHLGVKFIGVEARSIEPGFGTTQSWLDFVQVARGMQFQLLMTNVENSAQAATASQIARLVAGHFFAPPRRVKLNAGMNAANDLSVAA